MVHLVCPQYVKPRKRGFQTHPKNGRIWNRKNDHFYPILGYVRKSEKNVFLGSLVKMRNLLRPLWCVLTLQEQSEHAIGPIHMVSYCVLEHTALRCISVCSPTCTCCMFGHYMYTWCDHTYLWIPLPDTPFGGYMERCQNGSFLVKPCLYMLVTQAESALKQ